MPEQPEIEGTPPCGGAKCTAGPGGVYHRVPCDEARDPAPTTIGTPYHHEDERECYYLADGSGWWPYRFEEGVLNRSGGTVCPRLHPANRPGES